MAIISTGPEPLEERAYNLLVDEGAIALHQVRRAAEYIWSLRPEPHSPGTLVDSGSMINALRLLVSNFGLASTILFDDGPKRSSENSVVYGLRRARVGRVAALTAGIDTSIFQRRAIRNKFMHVDEHLAKALMQENTEWLINIGLSTRSLVRGENHLQYCRVYVFDEDMLLHLGEEFPVRQAYDRSGEILAVLPEAS